MSFFVFDRSLRPKGLHPPRGVAASGFPPLRNIPYCCLPQESGPCLSPNLADHPLRSATDRSFGKPLPYQLANPTRAHLKAINLSPEGLIRYQLSFPIVIPNLQVDSHALLNRLPLSTWRTKFLVRLACIKRAANVRSEPGSNS